MNPEDRDCHYLEVISPKLLELGASLCNATGIDDDVLAEVVYQELVRFHELQAAMGLWHPNLTEAVADFTRDDRAALGYYQQALAEAAEHGSEAHTINIDMARRLAELGRLEQAEAHAQSGLAEAIRHGDKDYQEQAEELLVEISKKI